MTRPSKKSTTCIWVDEREPAGTADALAAAGFETVLTRLDCGDYMFFVDGVRFIVERKTVGDLIGSLKKGRLSEQVQRMLKEADVPILLVLGECHRDYDGYLSFRSGTFWVRSGWPYSSVEMALLELQMAGILVVRWLPSEDHVGALKHIARSRSGEFLRRRQRPAASYSPPVWALCALPGVGPATASALLEAMGGLRNVANATVEELAEVVVNGRKFGQARARRLWEAFAWRGTSGE